MIKRFRKLRLFKQLSVIMFAVVILAFIFISTILSVFSERSMEKNKEILKNDILNSSILYLESTGDRLHSMAVSYSKWDDMAKASKNKDSEWIKDNATNFLTDNSVYMIDFVYFKDVKNGFSGSLGTITGNIVLTISEFADSKFTESNLDNIKDGFKMLLHSGTKHYVISICPIIKVDGSDFRGYYVAGYRIDNRINDVIGAQFKRDADLQVTLFPCCTEMNLVTELDKDKLVQPPYFLEINMKNLFFNKRLYELIQIIFIVLFIISGLALVFARNTLMRMSTTVDLIKNKIIGISDGDYNNRVEIEFSKEFDEINRAVNALSDELKINKRKVDENYFDMIAMLTKAIEEVDKYTKGHSARVSIYAEAIAKEIEYDDIQSIRLSALLHDIGKITTDPAIINKKGKLTPEEFDNIKRHPVTGHAILEISTIFDETKDAVLYHHEKLDGSGYPSGLKDDEIPLSAKIIAVADVFDALTTSRSYRDKMEIGQAIELLNSMRDTHLDKYLVNVLTKQAGDLYVEAHKIADNVSYIELLRAEYLQMDH